MTENRSARRSDADWDKLVDEWMESGQRQASFAVARGIRATTFQKAAWKSRGRRGLSCVEPHARLTLKEEKFTNKADQGYRIGRRSEVKNVPRKIDRRGQIKKGSRFSGPDFPGAGSVASSRYTLTASAPFGSTKKHIRQKKSTGGRSPGSSVRFVEKYVDSVVSVRMSGMSSSYTRIVRVGFR